MQFRVVPIALLASALLIPSVFATPILQPPWNPTARTATSQEWEFIRAPNAVPQGGLAPDGLTTPLKNPGVARANPAGCVTGMIGDRTDVWVGGENACEINFGIQNIADNLGLKHVFILVEFGAGDTPPSVPLGPIVAFPPAGQTARIRNLTGVEVMDIFPMVDFHLFTFDIVPNPIAEVFQLRVPPGTRIDQVIVHTISIPEPGTSALMGIGALWLAAVWCAKRAARRSPSGWH